MIIIAPIISNKNSNNNTKNIQNININTKNTEETKNMASTITTTVTTAPPLTNKATQGIQSNTNANANSDAKQQQQQQQPRTEGVITTTVNNNNTINSNVSKINKKRKFDEFEEPQPITRRKSTVSNADSTTGRRAKRLKTPKSWFEEASTCITRLRKTCKGDIEVFFRPGLFELLGL